MKAQIVRFERDLSHTRDTSDVSYTLYIKRKKRTCLDQSVDSSNVATTGQVDDIFVGSIDSELCSVVADTRKVGAEKREHDGHGGLGEDFVVLLAEHIRDEDQQDKAEIHELMAELLKQVLHRYLCLRQKSEGKRSSQRSNQVHSCGSS